MRARFDQLGKRIVHQALSPLGTLQTEHEIPAADAQSGDAYFVPSPEARADRAALGWLDQMSREPCLLELFQRTPGPVHVRACVRKQLALDHAAGREARKQNRRRPALLHLWMITTGRPRDVLDGHAMTTAEGWPSGVWLGPRLGAMALVVLRDLPRVRETLLLRLLGRGRVLHQAIAELRALPEDAKEREIAYEALVALRLEVQHDPTPDDETRAYLMATQDLLEQYKQDLLKQYKRRVERTAEARGTKRGLEKGLEQGREEGMRQTLVTLYEARFGPMPEALRKALGTAAHASELKRWVDLVGTATQKEIAVALARDARTNGARSKR